MARQIGAGKSVVALPLDYVVVDTETTGLSPVECGLIEISALRVENGRVTETFSSLVRPPVREEFRRGAWRDTYVEPFIENLTGITNEMLAEAPFPEEVIPRAEEFFGASILLGHNVGFDMGFLNAAFRKELGRPISNDYLDTLRLSRKLQPELAHHRLSDLAEAFGISYEGAHRAETDCRITNACYLGLREMALSRFSEEEFIRFFPRKNFQALAKDITPQREAADSTHLLHGKRVFFAGELKGISRNAAMQAVADLGGVNCDSVGARTDFLVVGSTTSLGGKAAPISLTLSGKKLCILTEQAFLELLAEGNWEEKKERPRPIP